MTYEEKYNYLTEHDIATDDEISLVVRINGFSTEQLDNILFVRTGYRSFESYDYNEGDEYERRMSKELEEEWNEELADDYLNEYDPIDILKMIL